MREVKSIETMQTGPEVMIFDNSEFGKIRTVEISGEIWFVGKDVALALGYSNPQKAIRDHVDEDDRTVNETFTVNGTMGVLINESGLYALILASKLPDAKRFKQWVTRDVIPSIRKTGAYAARPMSPAEMFQLQAQVNLDQERRIAALEDRTAATQQQITDVVSAFAVPAFSPDQWQEQANQTINRIVEMNHLNHQKFRHKLYEELERVANCNLKMRQDKLKARMRNGGAKTSEISAISKLAVIARDAKLRAIFEGILRREAALCLAAC